MTKEQIYEFMTKAGYFHIATVDGNKPRVRAMMLYKADEKGIIFHCGAFRDFYKQMLKNPNVELCFNNYEQNIQVRVSGKLEIINDNKLKDEISNHPSRQFLQGWKNSIPLEEFYKNFIVFKLNGGTATVWSMAKNREPKIVVELG